MEDTIENAAHKMEDNSETIRHKILTEGRAARNLVVWSVPVSYNDASGSEAAQEDFTTVLSKKKRKDQVHAKAKAQKERSTVGPRRKNTVAEKIKNPKDETSSKLPHTPVDPPSSPRPIQKKVDFRATYWQYLLGKLNTALDNMYTACEEEAHPLACEEVLMALNLAQRDFSELIKRFKLQTDFEKSDEATRPQSLAWEVRKNIFPAAAAPLSPTSRYYPPSPPFLPSIQYYPLYVI